MPMAIRPGTMNTSYSTPPTWRMRPPSESPKTRMNRKLETTGAATVCDQSLKTRSTSRPVRATRPRWRARTRVTPRRLGPAPDEPAHQEGDGDQDHARVLEAVGHHAARQVADVEDVLARLRGRRGRRLGRRRRRRLGWGRRRGGLLAERPGEVVGERADQPPG